MNSDLDLSVLIATYNRAEILRETLEAFTRLNREGLSVEFIVIDNNSLDDTKSVVESFFGRLPLVYLFEPASGKNRALNKAINEVELGEIVAFTDDDVRPAADWLQAMATATRRWPDYDLFGGQLHPVFPEATPVPKWAYDRDIVRWGYGLHAPADCDKPYPKGGHPCGANMWIRGKIFANGHRYDETIGPSGKMLFAMGSETSLLLELESEGFPMMYVPDAIVGHSIQPNQLSERYMLRRAVRYGRGLARIRGVSKANLLKRSRMLWYLFRAFVSCYLILAFLFRMGVFSLSGRGYEKMCHIAIWFTFHAESFRMVRERHVSSAPSC